MKTKALAYATGIMAGLVALGFATGRIRIKITRAPELFTAKFSGGDWDYIEFLEDAHEWEQDRSEDY